MNGDAYDVTTFADDDATNAWAASHFEVLQHAMGCTHGCVVRAGVVGGAPLEIDADYWVGFNVGLTPVAVELVGPWLTREQLNNCG